MNKNTPPNSASVQNEGYTKFVAHLSPGTVPWSPECDTLDAARTRLHDLRWLGIYPNGIGFGNVSLRLPGDSGFIISGTATGGARKLGQNGYCVVNDWRAESNEVWCRGPIQASSEAMSHGAVYKANSAVRCVLHIHSRELFDFMLAGDFPRTPADAAFGTPGIAIAITNLVRHDDSAGGAFVMAGHQEGIMAYGSSIERAIEHLDKIHRDWLSRNYPRGTELH